MEGVIVSNGFLQGRKFSEPADMLCASAESMGISLRRMTNDDLALPIGNRDTMHDSVGDADFVIFWDKDIRCCANLEICGYRTFNSSECIRICDDKALTHLTLSGRGIPSPMTIACPLSFDGYDDYSFAERAADVLGFPMVVKDCFGSFGMQVRLVDGMDSLIRCLSGPPVPRILQEYVECGSQDIRVEVVGGKVVAAVRREGPAGDFRSNCTIGGTMHLYDPSDAETSLAIAACEAVGADYAGVDIMEAPDGPVVCEVNSNAHMRNLMDCTGRDVSRDILEHIARTVGRSDGVLDSLRSYGSR